MDSSGDKDNRKTKENDNSTNFPKELECDPDSGSNSEELISKTDDVYKCKRPAEGKTGDHDPAVPKPIKNPTPEGESAGVRNYDSLITQVMEMGFPHNKVMKALEKNNYNAEAAIEALLFDQGGETLKSSAASECFNDFSSSQAPEIQELSHADCEGGSPEESSELLQNNSNATEDQDDANDETYDTDSNVEEPEFDDDDDDEDDEEGEVPEESRSLPPNMMSMAVEDREAIKMLVAMGFPEDLVIQVYFACNRDRHSAANFLQQNHGSL